MCLLICLLSAVLLGILYLFFGAFPLVFENNHGFELWQVGLTFLGIFIGMMIGISSDVLWKRNYARLVRNYSAETGIEGDSEPEFRLPPTIAGAWVVPIALFGEFRHFLRTMMAIVRVRVCVAFTLCKTLQLRDYF